LKTLGLFSQTYGRFEFRAKLPQGQGYWPALWMMPVNSVYGAWAASGEIDVMENNGSNPTTVLGTIHYGGTSPNQARSPGPAYTFPAGDSVTNFHVYALEWTSNAINWYVDGQLYETQTYWWSSGGPYPAPFDQPFYLIVNLAVGGNFVGNPSANTVFPGVMQVDYVRVYEWAAVPQLTITLSGADVILTWPISGCTTNVVQATNGGAGGSYSNNFTDLSLPIIFPGTGLVMTNYTDTNGATNTSRFYRIKIESP
jgi:beta-glucanase (GH16 family)